MCMRMAFNSWYRSIWWEFQMLCLPFLTTIQPASLQTNQPTRFCLTKAIFRTSIEYSTFATGNIRATAKIKSQIDAILRLFPSAISTSKHHVFFMYNSCIEHWSVCHICEHWTHIDATWNASLKWKYARQRTSQVIRMHECTTYTDRQAHRQSEFQYNGTICSLNTTGSSSHFSRICVFHFTGKNKNVTHRYFLCSVFTVIVRCSCWFCRLFARFANEFRSHYKPKTCGAHSVVESH